MLTSNIAALDVGLGNAIHDFWIRPFHAGILGRQELVHAEQLVFGNGPRMAVKLA